jgi:hypothetical protein
LAPEPFFEEAGHIVDTMDPLLTDAQVLGLLAEAHLALGHSHGITHTEIRLTAAGARVIEVNGRLGGDLIPLLATLANGLDPAGAAIALALGRRPPDRPEQGRSAGIRFLYPPQDCVVRRIELPGSGTFDDRVTFTALAAPGDTLLLPPRGYVARHAAVTAVADGPQEVDALLDEAADHVRLEWDVHV